MKLLQSPELINEIKKILEKNKSSNKAYTEIERLIIKNRNENFLISFCKENIENFDIEDLEKLTDSDCYSYDDKFLIGDYADLVQYAYENERNYIDSYGCRVNEYFEKFPEEVQAKIKMRGINTDLEEAIVNYNLKNGMTIAEVCNCEFIAEKCETYILKYEWA